jgi:aspartyl-tRNA(Asn)/glutamyl-tRNA(Gln) amidotransferase subunit B
MADAPLYNGYEAVIGLEVHAQMLTRTKIFCGCPTTFGAEPNTQTCPVCLGMPGSLPVLNEEALACTVRTGLALSCGIAPLSRFARKNYFYPDLPKGYQISQYELPICVGGHLDIELDGQTRRIGITRIHMEEDAGKNIHEEGRATSLVDLNRAGTPLMEIVSEPDIRSPREAAEYMRTLRAILRFLGVSDGNMEEGSLRCDANISVRKPGSALGTRAELKNINSFRFVERAIEYEIGRQVKAVDRGGAVVQETRLYDTEAGVTVSMRSKEEAHDYRYFPDPDLVPIAVGAGTVEAVRASLPELPRARRARYIEGLGLPAQDAAFLSEDRPTAEWFESAIAMGAPAKAVANWIMGELARKLGEEGIGIEACPLLPAQLAGLIALIEKGTISRAIAKTVFDEIWKTGADAETVVREKGLVQISDAGAIEGAVDEVLAKHQAEVERLRAGEEKLRGFLVGQVMKLTKGKANPQTVGEILSKKLL